MSMSLRSLLWVVAFVVFSVPQAHGAADTAEDLLGPGRPVVDDLAAVPPPEVQSAPARDAKSQEARDRALALLRSGDFVGLEAQFTELRSFKVDASPYAWPLAHAYAALAEAGGRDDLRDRFGAWAEAAPASTTFAVAGAQSLLRRVVYSSDMAAEECLRILDSAATMLEQALGRGGVSDPHLFAVALVVAGRRGRPPAYLNELAAKGREVHASYVPLMGALAVYLATGGYRATWKTPTVDYDALTPEASLPPHLVDRGAPADPGNGRTSGHTAGEDYATAALAALAQGMERCPTTLPWPPLREALGGLNRRTPGSLRLLGATAALAVLYQDRDLARACFRRLGDEYRAPPPWTLAMADAAREWALGRGQWPCYGARVPPADLPEVPLSPQTRLPARPAESERAFLYDTGPAAYAKVGFHNPSWDHDVIAALAGQGSQQERDDLARALEGGCVDALAAYFYACLSEKFTRPIAGELAKRYNNAAVRMRESAYHPYRRFQAMAGAAMAWARASGKGGDEAATRRSTSFHEGALALLPSVLAASDTPARLRATAWLALAEARVALTGDKDSAYTALAADLERVVPASGAALTAKGYALVGQAWAARGTGFASTVTAQGSQLFVERLREAKAALVLAAEREPGDPLAPTKMLSVCMGLGEPRDVMEKWFERALAAEPDCFAAYAAKLTYLLPRWYGSPEVLRGFLRQCVERTRAGGPTSLAGLLLQGHQFLEREHRLRGATMSYWLLPDVWPELRSTYQLMLERVEPSGRGYFLSSFARAACDCGQWAEAHRLFGLVGESPDYRAFDWKSAVFLAFKEQAAALGAPARAP